MAGDDARAAQEFGEDGGEHGRGDGETHDRIKASVGECAVFPGIDAYREADDDRGPEGDDGHHEIAANAFEGR